MSSILEGIGNRPVFDTSPEDRNYEKKMVQHQQELNLFLARVQNAVYTITEQASTHRELNKARHDAIMEAARKFGG